MAILLLMSSCKSNPCKDVETYDNFIPGLTDYFYKAGSFWVYMDSVDDIVDSQYVYSYSLRTHYRNPLDTPNKLYLPVGIGPSLSSNYCGPYFLDSVYMNIASVQNGRSYDTITYCSPGSSDIAIFGHNVPYQRSSGTGFFVDWTKLGFLNCCDYVYPIGSSADTTGSWYGGVLANINSGPYIFNNVSLWTFLIEDGTCPRLAYKTDFYIKPGYGTVKMVQHLPTGDKKWDIINYHIVN